MVSILRRHRWFIYYTDNTGAQWVSVTAKGPKGDPGDGSGGGGTAGVTSIIAGA